MLVVIFITIFPPKMHFLCRWFGHKIGGGYYKREGGEYFNVKVGPIDGIDRVHCHLYTECERCGEQYQVGMIHLPTVDDWIANRLKRSYRETK